MYIILDPSITLTSSRGLRPRVGGAQVAGLYLVRPAWRGYESTKKAPIQSGQDSAGIG